MDDNFFMTFGAENSECLNKQISEYCMDNNCKEIARSSPAAACYEGYFYIVVTSTLVKLTKTEKLMGDPQRVSAIRDFVERGKKE